MLHRITRTIKPYVFLLLICFLVVGASPLADAGPPPSPDPVGETRDIEVPQTTTTDSDEQQTDATSISSKTVVAAEVDKSTQATTQPQPPAPTLPQAEDKRPAPVPQPKPQPKPNESATVTARQQELNTYVLNAIKDYTVGRYPYLVNTDYANYNGVTSNVYYQGHLLAKAHPSGNRASHCVGITFEVFMKAMRARNQAAGLNTESFNGMSASTMNDFMLKWYVAGAKAHNNLAVAIEGYGLGQRITNLASAKAGDFIDFSRTNGTGHAAVLISWIWQDGKIIGLRYWSSQPSTGGIAYNEEYFNVLRADGRPYGSVRMDKVYIGRVGPIDTYRR